MRKGRNGEKMEWNGENIGENSGPLTLLPVDRLTATDCNAAARAKKEELCCKEASDLIIPILFNQMYSGILF